MTRTADKALSAGDLVLTASGADGSQLAVTFRAAEAEVQGGKAQHVEHPHLNGWTDDCRNACGNATNN